MYESAFGNTKSAFEQTVSEILMVTFRDKINNQR